MAARGMTKMAGALMLALLWGEAAAAATPAAAEAAAAEPAPPRPAIWLLADEDTKIYLFGTVHILPPGLVWRSAALERIVAEADELVMETAEDPNEADPEALAPLLTLAKWAPLEWRVSPGRRKPLREMIESVGLAPESLGGAQTWAAAITISVAGIALAYGDGGQPAEALTGVEDSLQEDFTASRRPISGVETGEQQLGFLAALPMRDQREMLETMVDAWLEGDTGDLTAAGDEAWLSGDVERIGEEMGELPPALFDVLLTRRNRSWTDWLIARLDRPGTVLFAVGAGHLAGRDSVQSMLVARGFTVTRED